MWLSSWKRLPKSPKSLVDRCLRLGGTDDGRGSVGWLAEVLRVEGTYTALVIHGGRSSPHITVQPCPYIALSTLPLTTNQSLLLSANSNTSSAVHTPLYRSPSAIIAAISVASEPSIK